MATTISRLAIDLLVNSAGLQKEFNAALRPMQRFSRQMTAIGKDMSLRVTAPIVGLGATMLRSAGDFEAGMNVVKALTGATAEEFENLSNLSKELGATTQFSATEAASAIEMLAKNGLDYQAITQGALDATLKLSAATGTELPEAADIATDAMALFGIEAKNMAEAVDQIAGTTLNSKFDIQDYALALARGGTAASAAGVSFEEFNAVIAATSSNFASGMTAGTALKTLLTRLSPTTKEAAETMERLGLDFFDAKGEMMGMAEVADMMREKLSGLSEEDRINSLTAMFGTEGMNAAIALMRVGGEEVTRLQEAIGNTSAAEQAEARMKGLNGALTRLRSAAEAVAIAVAESGLIEAVTMIAEKAAKLFGQLSQTNPELLRVATIAATVVAAIGPLVLAFGQIAAALAPVIAFISAKGGLVAALGLLSNPIGIAVAAVGALTAAWVLWDEEIIAFVQGAGTLLAEYWAKFIEVLGHVKERAGEMVAHVISKMSELGAHIRNVFAGILENVANTVQGIKVWLQDKLTAILNAPGRAIDALGNKFQNLFKRVVGNSYVPDMVDRLEEEFMRMDRTFVDPSIASIQGLGDEFRSVADEVASQDFDLSSRDFQVGGVDGFGMPDNAPAQERQKLRQVLGHYESVGDGIGGIVGKIQDGFDGGIEGVLDFSTSILGEFDNLFGDLERMGGGFDPANWFVPQNGGLGSIFGGLGNIFGGGGGGGGLLGGILGGLGSIINPIGGLLGGIGNLFGGFFADGGVAPAGKVSVVGERGPELIMPASRSRVLPNESLSSLGSSTNKPGGVTVHLSQTNSFESGVSSQEVVEMMKKNGEAIVRSITDQIQRGGAFRKAIQN